MEIHQFIDHLLCLNSQAKKGLLALHSAKLFFENSKNSKKNSLNSMTSVEKVILDSDFFNTQNQKDEEICLWNDNNLRKLIGKQFPITNDISKVIHFFLYFFSFLLLMLIQK